MNTRFAFTLIVCALACACTASAFAKSNPSTDLTKEVAALRESIARLETKIDRLQESLTAASGNPPIPAPKTRNPFGVPDVENPDGPDIQQNISLADGLGKDNDENAKPWASAAGSGAAKPPNPSSIDGEWMSRWNMGPGTRWVPPYAAKIQTVGSRTYVFFRDHQGRFLGELKREGQILSGRLVGVDNPRDTSIFILRIVNMNRIDGAWRGKDAGRIDFQR